MHTEQYTSLFMVAFRKGKVRECSYQTVWVMFLTCYYNLFKFFVLKTSTSVAELPDLAAVDPGFSISADPASGCSKGFFKNFITFLFINRY